MADEIGITEAQAEAAKDRLYTALGEEKQTPHPYEHDDALNDRLYNVSRKVDKILHREPVENHAAILGMIQVSTQRRMHEHQAKQQQAQAAEAAEARRRAQFGPN